MDDLIGLLIFIIFGVINLLAQSAKKKKQRELGQAPEGSPKPRSTPSSIEEFFEEVAKKFEPQPTELPDWPEDRERPDYAAEQAQFTADIDPEPEPVAEIIPIPVKEEKEVSEPQQQAHHASLKTAMASIPSISSGFSSIRLPSPPGMNQGSGGTINYSLKSKKALRKAIIANVVFSAPRAFDASFENTIAK